MNKWGASASAYDYTPPDERIVSCQSKTVDNHYENTKTTPKGGFVFVGLDFRLEVM